MGNKRKMNGNIHGMQMEEFILGTVTRAIQIRNELESCGKPQKIRLK